MRVRRFISLLIVFAFGISVPQRAYADTFSAKNVTQVFISNQRAPELRVGAVSDYRIPVFGFDTPGAPTMETFNRGSNGRADSQSLLSGVGFYPLAQPQDPIKIPLDDVDVTICDCGDETVLVPGGFPKWPLVFLAGIPLFFIKGGEDILPPLIPTPPLPPAQTPTPSIPEPMSLVLLFTGLGAVGLRYRRSRKANREAKDYAD